MTVNDSFSMFIATYIHTFRVFVSYYHFILLDHFLPWWFYSEIFIALIIIFFLYNNDKYNINITYIKYTFTSFYHLNLNLHYFIIKSHHFLLQLFLLFLLLYWPTLLYSLINLTLIILYKRLKFYICLILYFLYFLILLMKHFLFLLQFYHNLMYTFL